ncbi:MAG: TonB-dependent receptor [Caulobacteraceae bacterium]
MRFRMDAVSGSIGHGGSEGAAGGGARGRGFATATSMIALSLGWVMATGSPAQAQPAAQRSAAKETTVGEVVVTATKVGAQQVSTVPMAIQAFSGATLEKQDVKDATDLIQLIPGASEAQQIGAGYHIFSFRGSGAGGPIGDGMIGYYLDETPFGVPNNQAAPPLKYFDIDHVEVLRGPQGTLYGQGSMGGVIIYHTKSPNLTHFAAEGEAALSSTADAGGPDWRFDGGVSLPIVTDHLALRLSGGYDYLAGYADVYQGAPVGAPYKRDANDIKSYDVQAVLLWQPNDRLTVRTRAWKFATEQNYLQVMASVNPPYLSNQGAVQGYDRRPAEYYSNTITYDLGQLTLTNATSYQKSLPGGFGTGLGLGPPLGVGTLINGGNADNLVNEFRLSTSGKGPVHWVGGAFYQNATGLYLFSLDFPSLHLKGDTKTKTENYSIFSEVSYDLFGGKLVPLVGVRYFQDDRSALSHSNGVPAFSQSKPNAWTWRANLAFYPSDDWMLFFNAGTGFRSGILQSQAQANAVIADGVPSALALTPDQLRNLEFGVKGWLFDRKVRIASSVYDIRYTNLQSAFNTSIGLAAFANLGDAKTTGVDIDATWVTPIQGLDLSVIGNVNTSEFTNVIPAFAKSNPRAANGQELFNTPPSNWRVDADYTTALPRNWDLFAHASATMVAKTKNQDPTVNLLKSYSLFNTSVGVRRGAYEIRLYGENLSDERGPTAANGPTLLAGPRPRTFGISVRAHMG